MDQTTTRGVTRSLLRNDVYAILLESILDQVLEPGEVLRDEELVRWLGVSRGPIRDALLRLREERLVEILPNRSTRVAPIDPTSSLETLDLLLTLLGLALRLSVPRLGAPQIQVAEARHEALRAAVGDEQVSDLGAATVDYIGFFAEHSGNAPLAAHVRRYAPHLQRAFYLPEVLALVPALVDHLGAVHRHVLGGDVHGAVAAVRALSDAVTKHDAEA